MAYTGTGTSYDPCMCTTWNDFVSALNYSKQSSAVNSYRVYVKFVDNTVIDMNEVAPMGISSPIYINGVHHIDGNGAIIKNLYVKGDKLFTNLLTTSNVQYEYNITFTNIHFLNMFCSSKRFIDAAQTSNSSNVNRTRYYFNQCSFSGLVGWNSFIHANTNTFAYQFCGCSFNLELLNKEFIFYNTGSNIPDFATNTIYDCQFKLRWRQTPLNLTGNLQSLFYTNPICNCYLCLDCPKPDDENVDNNLILSTSNMSYCIITSEDKDTYIHINGGSSIINIYNSDNFESYVGKLSYQEPLKNCIGVDSNKILDAMYLRSLGFPIGTE